MVRVQWLFVDRLRNIAPQDGGIRFLSTVVLLWSIRRWHSSAGILRAVCEWKFLRYGSVNLFRLRQSLAGRGGMETCSEVKWQSVSTV